MSLSNIMKRLYKDFIVALILVLFYFYNCALCNNTPFVENGDRVEINYTCYLHNGEIVATTNDNIVNSDKFNKSRIFLSPDYFYPVTVIAGQLESIAEKNDFKIFEDEIKERLSKTIIGTKQGETYNFNLTASSIEGIDENERFFKMAKVRKRTKTKYLSQSRYMRMSGGNAPEIGSEIELEPGFTGKVKSIENRNILIAVSAQDGSNVPTPPFDKGIVHDRGNYYEVDITAKNGDLVRIGPYVGRVISIDDGLIISDFANPFGGETFKCKVDIEHIEKRNNAAAENKNINYDDAKKMLDKAFKEAKESDSTMSTIDLSQQSIPEKSDIVQHGDFVRINYTETLPNGDLLYTTVREKALDKKIKKAESYIDQKYFAPEEIFLNEESIIPGLNDKLLGMKVGERKTLKIPYTYAYGAVDKHNISKFLREKKIPKSLLITTEDFITRFNALPILDNLVDIAPYIEARITKVTPQDCLIESKLISNEPIKEPYGITMAHIEGDDIVINLDPKIGALFLFNDKKGKIIDKDEESFDVDFNDPRAGKDIIVDVEVVSITKSSRLQEIKISWFEDHDAGLDKAMQENKPVVLVLYADWCQWSQRLLNETLEDPSIKMLEDKFIWIKINSDKNQEIKELYNQEGFPFIAIMDSKLQILDKYDSYVNAKILHSKLHQWLLKISGV